MSKAQFSFWFLRVAVICVAALSLARAQVEGPGGHYYQVMLQAGLNWDEAKAAAEESTFNGVHGHLATITSAEEDQFIENLRLEAMPGGYNSLWVGGSQLSTATGTSDGWFWVNGEGPIPTSSAQEGYSNWQPTEPNDYNGPRSENYLSVGHFNNFGWNDETNGRHIYGYVVEYPSGGRGSVVKVVATDPSANEAPNQNPAPGASPIETARFTFTRTGNTALDLPVYYTIHGTAQNGIDYNEISQSIVIPAGQSEVVLTIVPRQDVLAVVEPTETVGIRIEPSRIGTQTSAYDIDLDHREAVAVIFETSEQKPFVDIGVPRNNFQYKLGEPIVVVAAVVHCCESVTKVEFFANDHLFTTLNRTEDLRGLEFFRGTWADAPEGAYDLRVRVTFSTGALATSKVVRVYVVGPAQPTVGIYYVQPDTTEPVPMADYAPGNFEVRLSKAMPENLQIFYTVGGTATAGVDYEALQGYVFVAAGRTSARIQINEKDDTIYEGNETIVLTLARPGEGPDATLPETYLIDSAHKAAEIVIFDNEQPDSPAVVSIHAEDAEANEFPPLAEGFNPARFKIERSGNTSRDLQVFFSIHGTAKNGEDYERIASPITIPAGQSSVALQIVPLSDVVAGTHKYEVVAEQLSWPQARTKAEAMSYEGVKGHLATITSREEDEYVFSLFQQSGLAFVWGGGYQEPGETSVTGNWRWVNNEGMIPGNNEQPGYANWLPGEPNDYWGVASENHLAIGWGGGFGWNDQTPNMPAPGYVVEFDVPGDGSVDELMETVGIRLEPSPQAGPLPTYTIDDYYHTAAAVIFDRLAPANGAIEVAIPTSGAIYNPDHVDFWVAGYHPTMDVQVVEFFVDNVEVGLSRVDRAAPVQGGVIQHRLVWSEARNGQHTLQAKATLSNGQTLVSSRIPFTVQGVVEPGTTVSITALHTQISEAAVNSTGVFEIVRTGPTTEALEVFLDYTGAAIPGTDYAILPEKVTIPVGAASAFLNVGPFNDQIIEGDETVIATLSPLRGVLYNIDPDRKSATMIIRDDDTDTVVRVEAVDPIATEIPPTSDRPEDPGAFRITRTGSLTESLQVFYSIHGTARNGGDYETIPESITIPAGQASAEIRIVPLPDLPTVSHHYEIVAAPNLTWEQARINAEQATHGGVQGHLATITSADEDARIEELRVQNGGLYLWVGGYQEAGETSITEGWKWVNNEGPIPGRNSDSGYSNWLGNEPNDYWGAGSEQHMVIGWLNTFGWNDQGQNIGAQGYLVEFEMQMGVPEEIENVMETVAIRLERSPLASPNPIYKIDLNNRSAAVVIFDGQAPAGGAIEVAIPSAGEVFSAPGIEFLVAAYHPTLDISPVDFYLDDMKIGTSHDTSLDPVMGGVIQHRLRWDYPTTGDHILQAKASVNGANLVSSKVPFSVRGMPNEPPVATVTKPQEGDAFIQGEPIDVSVISHDPDGTVAKLEVLLDGTVVKMATVPSVDFTILPEPGQHSLRARVTDNNGVVGLSPIVHILVRHRDSVAFVHRELPAGYSPGVSFLVELRADPPEGAFAYAVEDSPPTGWRVTEISDDGGFDSVNGKVKFGPFTDNLPRTLTYPVTPPSSAVGTHEFKGSGSVNGAVYPITGDARIEFSNQQHPADSNDDFKIALAEVTAYSAAWKSGRSWPTGPVPIPLNYVTRAHFIWQRGESYHFDPAAGAAPRCWVPNSGGSGGFTIAGAATGGAQRAYSGDIRVDAANVVQINVVPASGSSGYAVEERPPHGWTISNITHDGIFDPGTGIIRWGVFSDGFARTLSYTATPPPTVSSVGIFSGQLSYDGQLVQILADARLDNSVAVNGTAPIVINSCEATSYGLKLNISGPSGQTGVIEASTDFTDWTEVKSIFIPDGSVEFTDDGPAASRRFYRLRVQ